MTDRETTYLHIRMKGRAFALHSSREIPCELFVSDSGRAVLTSEDGATVEDVAAEDLDVASPLGSAPRRITFPGGLVFETSDHDAVTQLTGATRGGLLHHYEQFSPRLVGVIAAAVLSVWIIWRYGLDILVTAAIALTPPILVDQIDRGTLKTIDLTMAETSTLDDAERDRVEQIFRTLLDDLPADQREKHDFTLLFRSMPDVGPNAFALPGGTVIMTDQFIEEFPGRDVLAGVLGHELGHVVEQHGLQQTYRSLGVFILIAFLAGDTGPILEDVLLEGSLLLSLSYSRSHETAADEFGLALSHRAGFDPAGLAVFFEKISEMGEGPPEWMSTHPANENRIEAIETFIETLDAP
ncbi:M48 family metallopeptidase [Litoreibacter roseus]|uniref:Metalloprotease n=1 Tax=Litoreibacter roseus TaxID=2601869 RepID=A0A6N6JFJ8_9RHOB|nr:M48 family metallopeptidase [Litoreibacter roseus]GFE64737.1 metalloprotease [Litoreibacter roseus]